MHLFDTDRLQHLDDPHRTAQIPVKKIASELELKDGMSVADIGCGSGYFSFAFAEYIKPRGKLTGFDVQQASIDFCNNKKTSKDTNISFILNTPGNIPAPDSSFDAATMILVAHELSESRTFLNEVQRILKPGAKLALIEWQMAQTEDGPPLIERISSDMLQKLLADTGFNIVKNKISGKNHYFIVAEKITLYRR